MKKFGKILLYAVIVIILLIVVVISYVTLALPNVGKAEDITVKPTPGRIARGKYLANNISLCTDCHSKRDWTKYGAPIIPGTLGGGGELFDVSVGFPGTVHVPNITPYKLKDWTDGEIFRAITTGVRKNGDPIFPLMPWPYYSKMSREDIYSIIAYLRTLTPIKADYPKSKLDLPLNIIVHTMPQKAELGEVPPATDSVKYGEYLVQSAACVECHTQEDKGKLIAGMEFAGGRTFVVAGKTIHSANITQDKETGIGNWTQATMVGGLKAYADPSKGRHIGPNDFQTIMPLYSYAGITEGDLKTMYLYLKTIKPIKNKVVNR
jgi:mono/diheme cytochrome c family protein